MSFEDDNPFYERCLECDAVFPAEALRMGLCALCSLLGAVPPADPLRVTHADRRILAFLDAERRVRISHKLKLVQVFEWHLMGTRTDANGRTTFLGITK